MRGGSPAERCSITVTSMPRQARSIARVRPTGPAPTTSTEVSIARLTIFPPGRDRPDAAMQRRFTFAAASRGWERKMGSARRLCADLLNDARELGALRFDQGGEFRRRGSVGNLAKSSQALDNSGLGRNRTDVAG